MTHDDLKDAPAPAARPAPTATATPTPTPTPTPTAAPAHPRAFDDEAAAIDSRRKAAAEALGTAAPADFPKLPRVGLALSGGGVRSATYCFGFLRGLASNGLLPRIDYLSTVSGGGFIGAMFGRLVTALGIVRAQAALTEGNSLLLWWLRGNGRYLTPAGSRDLGMAIATYFRAWFAIHLEVSTLFVLAALAIVLPHLIQDATHRLAVADWRLGYTPWWPLAAMWFAVSVPGAMAAYWVARDVPARLQPAAQAAVPERARSRVAVLATTVFALAGMVLLGASAWVVAGSGEPIGLPSATELAAVSALAVAVLVAFTRLRLVGTPEAALTLRLAELRNELTRALRLAILVGAVLAAIGLLDIASWEILLRLLSKEQPWLGLGAGIGGVALVLVRAFAERLQRAARDIDGPKGTSWGPRLLNWIGVVGAVVLFLGWLVGVQWFVFAGPPWDWLRSAEPWERALGLALVVLGWIAWTGRHEDSANASSLHSFYRARLTRAYLSIGNPDRFKTDVSTPPDDAVVKAVEAVTDVVPGDDCSLRGYRPEAKGGPIHLINTCLNQTHDDRSGLYNADRKGLILTASAHGFEVGRDRLIPMHADDDPGTLGRWVAVSGAAAAPGAGSYTSRGWAAMLFLLGVRLGYWIRAPRDDAEPAAAPTGIRHWLVKQTMLRDEATATFYGASRPWWYLSDGGHFDNTGVYALLRRELDFIVLADCSADGHFAFADVENLVRKARIDFDTDIEFYTRGDAAPFFAWHGGDVTVLSPEDMADNHSARGVLLARVTYRRSDPAGARHGTLLVVKPNLHVALDVDLLAYAQRNPTFPHQSTGDQFFDEAQWESYHRLGEDLGRALTDTWLAQLPGWSRPARHVPGETAPLRRAALAVGAAAGVPAWRKTAQAAAVGATLGIGATGTLLLTAWQALQQVQKDSDERVVQATAVFTDAVKSLSRLEDRPPGADPLASFQAQRLVALQPERLPQEPLRKGIEDLIHRVTARCAELVPARAGERVDARVVDFCAEWTDALGRFDLSSGDALVYWTQPPMPQPVAPAKTSAVVARVEPGPVAMAPAPVPEPASVPAPDPLEASPDAASPPAARDVPVHAAKRRSPIAVSPRPTSAGSAADRDSDGETVSSSTLKACAPDGVTKVRLYTQIYDESMRPAAAALLGNLARDGAGIRAAGIENVNRTAETQGRRPPVPWKKPCLVVHDPADNLCAEALREEISRRWPYGGPVTYKPLPPNLKPQHGVIELWLPGPES